MRFMVIVKATKDSENEGAPPDPQLMAEMNKFNDELLEAGVLLGYDGLHPKYILKAFLTINDQMNDSIRAVESQTSPEEYKTFKHGVGHVMYEVFEQIVEPICKRHPSLRPPEMEA